MIKKANGDIRVQAKDMCRVREIQRLLRNKYPYVARSKYNCKHGKSLRMSARLQQKNNNKNNKDYDKRRNRCYDVCA